MPSLADLLHRFRRLGSPPGAPAAGLGVPEQPGATITGELVQVFGAIDELQCGADRIVGEAESQAAAHRDLARREAARIREDAEREASRVRDSTLEHARATLDEEVQTVRAAGARAAGTISDQAPQRSARLARSVAQRLAETAQ